MAARKKPAARKTAARRTPAKRTPAKRRAAPRRAAAPVARRRSKKRVSQKFDTVAKEAVMLAVGQLAADFASSFVTSKVGDKITKLTLGGKLDPVALVMGVVGVNLAKKRSKNRMLFMGIASGGIKKAVTGFIPAPAPTVSGVSYNSNRDLAAEILNDAGVNINAIPRISGGEDNIVSAIPRISGISRQF